MRFIEVSWLVTTNNYNTLTNLQILQITVAQTKFWQIFTGRCMVTAFYSGVSLLQCCSDCRLTSRRMLAVWPSPLSTASSLLSTWLGLKLLFPYWSLLMAGPLAGAPPLMFFCNRRTPVTVAGTSPEHWTPFSLHPDGRPSNPSLLATNNQVVSGHCSRATFTELSFKMGVISHQINCRAHCMGGPISGSPAVISGLAVDMDAPVMMITRYTFSLIRLSACRLSWRLFRRAECVARRQE
jgi:hypothetical protein